MHGITFVWNERSNNSFTCTAKRIKSMHSTACVKMSKIYATSLYFAVFYVHNYDKQMHDCYISENTR